MALYLLRTLFERTGGDNRDRVVWSFHVNSTGAPPSAVGWENHFANAWNSVSGFGSVIQGAYEVSMYQVYDVSAGGPPIDFKLPEEDRVMTTGTPGPQEVQVCITRWTDDSLGRPRKQGRWYVGPISGGQMTGADRPTALVAPLRDFQQDLHARLMSNLHQPVVLRKTPNLAVGFPITQYSIDDAWDTQRRRGIDPTADVIFATQV